MTADNVSTQPNLLRTIASPELADLIAAIGETVLDTATDPSFWRDLPVIGMAQKLAMVGADIHAKHFARKVISFLQTVESATLEEREKFLSQFRTEREQKEFNDQILLYLEKADAFRKPGIIGRLTVACIRGHLRLDDTKRLVAMVNRCYIDDLQLLVNFVDGVQGRNTAIAESLQAVGFLSNEGPDGGGFSPDMPGGTHFALNEYGRWLVQYGGIADEA